MFKLLNNKNINNILKDELALLKILLEDTTNSQKYIDILVAKISSFNSKSINYITHMFKYVFINSINIKKYK